MFKTIEEKSMQAEIVEKKSKFIANIFYVQTVEEAEDIIKEVKKKYYDARHNCFAYSIYTNEGVKNRFSDDGEPSGTAGSPMLNIITSKNLSNILVVVTRYFGGILLGTGGLVRAYTGAFQEALAKTNEVIKDIGCEMCFEITYSDLEKAKYYLNQKEIKITNIVYNEVIQIYFETVNEKVQKILEEKNNLNFNFENLKMVQEKYIDI